MSLTSISSFCGEANEPGLITIQYLPTAWVNTAAYEELISSNYNWQIDIPLAMGSWLDAKAFPYKKLWNESQRNAKPAPYYEQLVKGIIPNLKPTVSGLFNKMGNYTYLLKIKDRQDRDWILGTLKHPFRFIAKGTTGEGTGLKHHEINFVAQTPHKAYGFTPI